MEESESEIERRLIRRYQILMDEKAETMWLQHKLSESPLFLQRLLSKPLEQRFERTMRRFALLEMERASFLESKYVKLSTESDMKALEILQNSGLSPVQAASGLAFEWFPPEFWHQCGKSPRVVIAVNTDPSMFTEMIELKVSADIVDLEFCGCGGWELYSAASKWKEFPEYSAQAVLSAFPSDEWCPTATGGCPCAFGNPCRGESYRDMLVSGKTLDFLDYVGLVQLSLIEEIT